MDLRPYLSEYHIDLCGVLPLDECRILHPHLLCRAGFSEDETAGDRLFVQLFAIPYLSRSAAHPARNLSAYAIGRDYHLFVRELLDDLLQRLRCEHPDYRFAGFADHSPIDEITAAVAAGMGVRGRNHLLLTERYSSYVFLAEIITDMPLTPTPTALPTELQHCHNCGKCEEACPMVREGGLCRSALTQKKDPLTEDERRTLQDFPLVWGCDACQEVCPYTAHAIARGTIWTPIPFFEEQLIPCLTLDVLDAMSDEEFAARAYAWRGRKTIRRNLILHPTFCT